jgi:regulator of sigma E protease
LSGQTTPLDPRIAARLHRQPASAVLVAEVQADSAAAEAGFQAGDVLLAFDSETVASVDDLHRKLTAERAGRVVEAKVMRMGRVETLIVVPRADD